MSQQFQHSEHRQFIRSPHYQRNANITTGHCESVHVRAVKEWPAFAPFPLWLRGVYTWEYGDSTDGTAFQQMMEYAGFNSTIGGPFTIRGMVKDGVQGDLRLLTRYRHALFSMSGTALVGTESGPVLVPYEWTYEVGYHHLSGALYYERGLNGAAEFYSYELDDAGVVVTSGSVNGWMDTPMETVPQDWWYNWQGSILSDPGTSAVLTVTETSATLNITLIDGVVMNAEWTMFNPGSGDATTLEDAFGLCEAMLDTATIDNLATDYGTILNDDATNMQWGKTYLLWYRHAPGVPLELVYEWVSWGAPAVAERYLVLDGITFANAVQMSKSRAGLANQSTSLYSESQSLPEASTIPPPGDDGSNGTTVPEIPEPIPDATTDCVLGFAEGAEYMLVPGDLIYDFGRCTLARTCAGNTLCTP